MDPNATVKRITELFLDGEFHDALESAFDLRLWLMRGGFPPDGMTTDEAMLFTRASIESAERALDVK